MESESDDKGMAIIIFNASGQMKFPTCLSNFMDLLFTGYEIREKQVVRSSCFSEFFRLKAGLQTRKNFCPNAVGLSG